MYTLYNKCDPAQLYYIYILRVVGLLKKKKKNVRKKGRDTILENKFLKGFYSKKKERSRQNAYNTPIKIKRRFKICLI